MGIDLCHKHQRKVIRRHVVSKDPYIRLLATLYKYIARKTGCKFNAVVHKRIIMANRHKQPMSLSRLARQYRKPGNDGKIAVIVGTVTDDKRIYEVPKMTVAALRVTDPARARIIAAGGEILTLDQLALKAPKGEKTIFLQAPRKSRTSEKYFGRAPGVPDSHTRPRIQSKGRKFERARGRRKSRGYKN
uniref:Large ribosomal subunit protein eL18 n=1 Tax=Panagrolaimus sp. JU765 TaxID=591449 RepID=A0AC34QZJ1_9BILA